MLRISIPLMVGWVGWSLCAYSASLLVLRLTGKRLMRFAARSKSILWNPRNNAVIKAVPLVCAIACAVFLSAIAEALKQRGN